MNYQSHYDRLIARARERVLVGYRERHHIVPRCIGGNDEPENIVALTAEEHFCAHMLLVKIHPGAEKIVNAAYFMSFLSRNNKVYAWLKRKLAYGMRGNTRSLGVKRTAETKAKMSASMRGNTNGRGKKLPPFTAEHRAKLASAKRGRTLKPEHVAKIAAANRGRKFGPLSPEHRAKLSLAKIGKKRPPEVSAKQSASMRLAWARKRAAVIAQA